MKDRTFSAVLFAVLAICVVITVLLIAYTVVQYQYVSIIHFIAKEVW